MTRDTRTHIHNGGDDAPSATLDRSASGVECARQGGTPPVARDILVLTATLTPQPDSFQLVRRDPIIRLQDYVTSLQFYLTKVPKVFDRLVFIENSGSDLRPLKDVATALGQNDRVVFVGLNCNDFPSKWGRGYGEFLLLDNGLAQVPGLRSHDRIWKVSGRLRVLNIERLVRHRPLKFDLYCDLRDVPLIGEAFGGNKWMDTRCWAATYAFFNSVFRGQCENMKHHDVGGSAEKYLYRLVRGLPDSHMIVPRFRIQPNIAGYSGYANADYQSVGYRAKNMVRAISRRLVPWVWL